MGDNEEPDLSRRSSSDSYLSPEDMFNEQLRPLTVSIQPSPNKQDTFRVIDPANEGFDVVLEVIGPFGPYQWLLTFVTQLGLISVAGALLSSTFIGLKHVSEEPGNVSCENTSRDSEFLTLTMHLGLSCNKMNILSFMSLSVMSGGVVGAMIVGHLADRFGRRSLTMITLAGCIAANVLLATTVHIAQALVTLFLVGIFGGGYMVVNVVWQLENIGQHFRLLGTSLNGFPMGMMVMALVGFITKNWRWYLVTNSAIGLPTLILTFFMYESPRWLIQQQRFGDAKHVIRKIAAKNNKTVPSLNLAPPSKDEKITYSYLDVLKHPGIRWRLTALCYSYFSSSVISFALYFQLGMLSGNVFLNTFLTGLFKICTGWIPFIADRWMGRKPVLCSAVFVMVTCCWSVVVIFFAQGTKKSMAITVISVIGASAIDPIWKINHLYSNELFPTVVRNMSRGLCNVFARLGSVVGPQVALYLIKLNFGAPYIVFGIIGIGHLVICILMLPETKGMIMPEKLEDKLQQKTFKRTAPSNIAAKA